MFIRFILNSKDEGLINRIKVETVKKKENLSVTDNFVSRKIFSKIVS